MAAMLGGVGTPFVSQRSVRVEVRQGLRKRVLVGQVGADRRGIWVQGELIVRQTQVKDAYLVGTDTSEPAVRVRRKGLRSPIDIDVPTVEEGRAILRGLGWDGAQAVLAVLRTEPRLGYPGLETALQVVFWSALLAIFPILLGIKLVPFGQACTCSSAGSPRSSWQPGSWGCQAGSPSEQTDSSSPGWVGLGSSRTTGS